MNAIEFGILVGVGVFLASMPITFALQRRHRRRKLAASSKLPTLAHQLYGPYRKRGQHEPGRRR